MKKFLSIIVALILSVSGAWATDISVGTSTGTFYKDGSTEITPSSSNQFANKWVATAAPALQITCGNNDMVINSSDATDTKFRLHTDTYTMTAPDGYIITGYSITGYATNGTSKINDTTVGTDDASATTVSNTNLSRYTISFTVSGTANPWMYIKSLTVTVEPIITSVAQFSNNKAYYVTTNDRGAWFVTNGGTAITSTAKAGFAPSTSDVKQQFAFLTYGTTGVYHLYSVSEKKFIAKDNGYSEGKSRTKLISELGDNVTLLTGTGDTRYPVVAALQDGAYQMGISNGYDPAVITFWNSLSDGGNKVQIHAVADFDPTEAMAILEAAYSTTVEVTYEVYDGETFIESKKVVQDKNSAVSVPASLLKNTWYYDYTPSGSIGTSNCTITVARTYKAGVVTTLSGLSNNKAYRLVTERGTFTTDNGALTNTCKTGSNYTVYNFAIVYYDGTDDAVDNGSYYLWSVQDGKFVAGSGTNLTETPTAITLNALTEPLFKFQCGLNYMNCNASEGGFFSGWSTTDGGNKVAIIEAADFDPAPVIAALTNLAPSVIANIKPFFDAAGSGLFQLKASVAEAYNATYTAALTTCSQSTYETLEGVVTNIDNFNLPETGKYYVMKNVSNGKYLNVKSASEIYADVDSPVPGSLIRRVVRAEKTYFETQGKEFGWCYSSGDPALLDNAGAGKYAHFSITNPGQIATAHCIGNGEGSYSGYLSSSYYAVNGSNRVIDSTATAAASQWIFEEVTSSTAINVTLKQVGNSYYATLCAPFAYTVSGATAYTLELNGNQLDMTEIGTVPAGTPVVLVGTTTENPKPETINATINIASNDYQGTSLTSTALTGIYIATDIDAANATSPKATNYFLGRKGGVVGFYQYDAAKLTLGANKAYLSIPLATSSSNGFKLVLADDDITAVAPINVQSSKANGQFYDLQGRKVKNPQKGQLYIHNGKTILY
ncbi:MAG: hypothetical protein J5678_00680 [Bacteroidaceae bacterium]|nr:hypothetical protein [Bacteroidaceae bacterium]